MIFDRFCRSLRDFTGVKSFSRNFEGFHGILSVFESFLKDVSRNDKRF